METPIRVLYMEDDAGLARLLQRSLARSGSYLVDIAGSGEEGLGMVARGRYDVVLVDHRMPGCSGVDVLRAAAGKKVFPPLIMVTSENNSTVAVEAMKAGAADFINKDTDLKYLDLVPEIIRRVLEKKRLTEEREAMEAKIRESEVRYRTLLELSPDAIGLLYNDVIQRLNPAGLQILGFDSLEALHEGRTPGRCLQEFIAPEDRNRYSTMMREVLRSTDKVVPWTEFYLRRADMASGHLPVELTAICCQWEGMKSVQVLFRDIGARKDAISRLEMQALTDPLTGLPNRTLFGDRLDQATKEAMRHKSLVAVLFIDLDHFKEVNDTCGHDAGDLVLKEVARRIKSTVRESDTVARLGGDEFCVLLPIINNEPNAGMVAEKILEFIRAPIETPKGPCRVGASIGITFYPNNARDPATLLQQSDAAMYQAKRSGRNQFGYYGSDTGFTRARGG